MNSPSSQNTGNPFFKVQNALIDNYTKLPGWNAGAFSVYVVLCRLYNTKYGYAFPTQTQIGQAAGMTRDTVRKHLRYLEEYTMIQIEKGEGRHANDRYYLPDLIGDQAEFFATFPAARSVAEKQQDDQAQEKASKQEYVQRMAAGRKEYKEKRQQRSKKAAARAADLIPPAAQIQDPAPMDDELAWI